MDRFEDFLTRFSRYSGVDTSGVVRLTPPWTYRLLALLTGVLLGGELFFLTLNHTAAAPSISCDQLIRLPVEGVARAGLAAEELPTSPHFREGYRD